LYAEAGTLTSVTDNSRATSEKAIRRM
jgi:hypothetical protein